jgi:flagellar hook-associated protein 3 FlgL
VTDTTKLTGHNYQLVFSVTPATSTTEAVTTYTVQDLTTGDPVPAAPNPPDPIPYTSGQSINFDGLQFDIKGKPADGDTFTVQPSTKQSVFTTVTDFLKALRSNGSGAAGQAALNNVLNQVQSNIDNATDNLLAVQAQVGSRLKELDYLDSNGDDMNLQYSSTLSDLQDLDYVKATSEFTQQQTILDAAQKTFKAVSGLSLFNYIS